MNSEEIIKAMAAIVGNHLSCESFRTNKRFMNLVEKKDGIKTAAIFAGLITIPELQANAIRLETLVHAFLSLSKGQVEPNRFVIKESFSLLAKTQFGLSEDPSENVFISQVFFSQGNFRIFEGLWECNSFYLQRFLDVIEEMPNEGMYSQLKLSVSGLLKISEYIIQRCNLQRYIIGNQYPINIIPDKILENLGSIKNRIKLSEDDLEKLFIIKKDIEPFLLPKKWFSSILKDNIGSSLLVRYPIVKEKNYYYLMLPSSISVAVRLFLIEKLSQVNMLNMLERALSISYEKHFKKMSLLGNLNEPPIRFITNTISKRVYCELVKNIDVGRYFHFLFLLDDFSNWQDGWMLSQNLSTKEIEDDIKQRIDEVKRNIKIEPNFKDGISLIVFCGWGRYTFLQKPEENDDDWKMEFISAPDLTTFSLTPEFNAQLFWKLLYARDKLKSCGGFIRNINGLVNLYGWAKKLDFHLVQHNQILGNPNEVVEIVIEQNCLLEIRQEAYKAWDEHITINPKREPVRVIKRSSSFYFGEDKKNPLYISVDDISKKELNAVYESTKCDWWCILKTFGDADSELVYRLWEAAMSWLHKSIFVIEKTFPRLSKNRIYWNLNFISPKTPILPIIQSDYFELRNLVNVTADDDMSIIATFKSEFINGFNQENNDAERCMIWTLVKGVELISGTQLSDIEREKVLDTIIVDKSAKSLHLFPCQTLLDYLGGNIPKPIKIHKIDDATSRIGLGWHAKSPQNGYDIAVIEDCVKYLNELTEKVWWNLRKYLKNYNRNLLIKKLLLNLESLRKEDQLWKRTIKACLAQHIDKNDINTVAKERAAERNALKLSNRIAIEIAICECPLVDGEMAGDIEVSRIMMFSLLLYFLGSWSDAMKSGVMPAKIKISRFGDVMIDPSFGRNIVEKYGEEIQLLIQKSDISKYGDLYKEKKYLKTTTDLFEPEFIDAWKDEYGFSIDEGRFFIDILEDKAIKDKMIVYEIGKRDFFVLIAGSDTSKKTVEAFLENLIIRPRKNWTFTPSGFSNSDWEPWHFRRCLSLTSRPIIQIDDETDPILIISPSLIRESFGYLLRNCYEAGFDDRRFHSNKMRIWIGRKRDTVGHDFNKEVADILSKEGWQTEHDIKLTKILNKHFDQNYGDVDVLAWRKDKGRVLIIECKKLEMAKTHREIANQINEFRGRNSKGGKPDRLKKHLLRIKIINENLRSLESFTRIDRIDEIEPYLVFSRIVPVVYFDDILKLIKIISVDSLLKI